MEFDDMQVTSGDSHEKNSDLDRYGVWVKKPPRTIHDNDDDQQKTPCNEPASHVDVESTGQLSMPKETDGIVSDSPEIDDMAFEMVDFDTELKDIPEMANENEDIPSKEDSISNKVIQEESDTLQDNSFEFDDSSENTQITPEPDFSDMTEIQEIDFSELLEEEDPPANDSANQTEQITPESEENKTISSIDESVPDFSDGEISLDAFFADSPTTTPSSNSSSMETVDMDSFGDGEISLDAFFDDGDGESFSVEDFMPTEKKEKNDILDEPPLDIQLSFDDDFVLNTKADPTGQMENFGDGSFSDFSSIIDDESGLGFDDLFDNIVDESEPPASGSTIVEIGETTAEQPQISQAETEFDEVTDFDDLLGELEDSTGTAAAPKDDSAKAVNNVIDYDITVSMDDDDVQEIKSIQTDTADEDIIDDISLYMDEPEKTQQNQGSHLDRTHTSEYTTSYVPPDDDFDIDKLMSEVEDIGGGNMQTDASNNENNNEMTEAMMSQSDMAASNDIFDDDFFEADPMIADPIISEDIESDVQESVLPDFLEEETPVDKPEASVNSFTEEILQEENFEEPVLVDENFTEDAFTEDALIEENLPEETLIEDALPENDETIMEDSLPDAAVDEISEPISEEESFSEGMESPMIEEEIPFVSDELTELDAEPLFEDEGELEDEPNNEEIFEEEASQDVFENDSISSEVAVAAEPEHLKEEKSDILNSIADELAVLRQEISMLKSDLENMKKSGIIASSDSTDKNEKPSSNESAFFSDTSDDDTIALSGDELSNILNTADFTEEEVEEIQETEPCEEPVEEEDRSSDDILYSDDDEESNNGLPQIDFESEQLEEPKIDEIEFDNEPEQQLPDEIEVPVTEDAVDEEPEEVLQEEAEVVPTVDDDIFGEPSTESIEDIFADKEETIDEEEVAFVTSEPELEETEESLVPTQEDLDTTEGLDDVDEPDNAEEEITDDSTEAMFESNQWEDESTLAAAAATGIATTAVVAAIADEINEDESVLDSDETISDEIDIEDDEVEEIAPEETLQENVPCEENLDVDEDLDTTDEELDSAITEITPEPEESLPEPEEPSSQASQIPDDLKRDIKSVLAYMDQLLDNLPEDKIAEFARSEHFELYKKLFTELGLS